MILYNPCWRSVYDEFDFPTGNRIHHKRTSSTDYTKSSQRGYPERTELTMLTDRPSYRALDAHYRNIRGRHLRELFAEDPNRGDRYHAEAAGLYVDYSKNRIGRAH